MRKGQTTWLVVIALIAVSSCAIYLPAATAFFANDDWVLLDFYGKIPPWQPWKYFSVKTIWFYRPLQSMQLGVLYNLFGLNELPYNLALLAMHFVTAALACLLLRAMGVSYPSTALAMAFFGTSWIYVDVLIWKSNCNTLQWAVVTIASCISFARYLQTSRRRWRLTTWVLVIFACFTKEMVVSLPLLLGIVWLFHPRIFPELNWRRPFRVAAMAIRELWPAGLIVLIYVGLHRLMVVDIAEGLDTVYIFSGPLEAIKHVVFAFNHALLPCLADPLFLPRLEWIKPYFLLTCLPLLPILILVGIVRRNRFLLFGCLWVTLSAMPALFLETFHTSRFYYLPALGAALVQAEVARCAFVRLRDSTGRVIQSLRFCVPAVAGYMMVVSVAQTQLILARDAEDSSTAKALFELLVASRDSLPQEPVIIIANPPDQYVNGNFGIAQMVRFALGNPSAEGVIMNSHLDEKDLARISSKSDVFKVDMAHLPLKLEAQTQRRDDITSAPG